MSEDEQIQWLLKFYPEYQNYLDPIPSLADLAFRLRDEMETNLQISHFAASLREVHLYVRLNPDIHNTDFIAFWLYEAKPIHWIIAALIAKDKEDE